MAAPTRISGGLRASQQGNVHVQGLTREQHTTTAIDSAKSQTHSAKTAVFGVFSPNGSAVWPRHHCKLRDHRHQTGGITPSKAPTRRRHAVRGLRMAQNPHHYRHGERQGHGEPGRSAHEQQKPSNRTQGRPHFRYKTRPAHPFSPHVRYKILLARPKWLNLARFARTGRVLYRSHHQEAKQGEFCGSSHLRV